MNLNLTQEQLAELNTLLQSPDLKIPQERRTVTTWGANLGWLQKHLPRSDAKLPARLKELLHPKKK